MSRVAAILRLLTVAIPVTLCAGCVGVRFTPSPMNIAMPADVLARRHLTNSAAYQGNLGVLAGHILFVRKVDGACPAQLANDFSALDLSLDTYVKNGEELKPSPTAVPRWESKIDRGAATSANITAGVASIAANLTESQAADILLTDVLLVVRDDQIDMPKLQAVASAPLPPDVCARLFVRGVALETLIYKDYISVASDATTSGTAFGANGKVYSTTNQFSQGYGLGLDLQRVSQAAKLNAIASALQLPATFRVPDGGFPRR